MNLNVQLKWKEQNIKQQRKEYKKSIGYEVENQFKTF